MALQRPLLDLEGFIEERDRCRDKTYESPHPVLREGFFENTNRMWDKVSGELAFATAVSPAHRRAAITTTFVLRLAGSARESEKPGMSGATPLMEKAMGTKAALRAYIRKMPFSGRKTYRAVLSKETLATVAPRIAKRVAKRTTARSLGSLTQRLTRYFQKETAKLGKPRKLAFHTLQIACDLYSLALIRVKRPSDCPLAIGSQRGLKHVRRWEDKGATIASLAVNLGRPAHTVQTSLCAYDKYVRWSNGHAMRPRTR